MLAVHAGIMALALVGVAVRSPEYLGAAFTPVTLNGLMIVCSAIAWPAAGRMPLAGRCLGRAPAQSAGNSAPPARIW